MWAHDTGKCHFCKRENYQDHDEDCPMVEPLPSQAGSDQIINPVITQQIAIDFYQRVFLAALAAGKEPDDCLNYAHTARMQLLVILGAKKP
jgi:hypothetical protein